MKELVKMLALAIWTIAAIVTSALSLNFDAFYIVCGLINIVLNGVCIYRVGKHLLGDVSNK